MTSLGLTPFRIALVYEIFGNIAALPSTLYNPASAIAILGGQPTGTAKHLTQFFGAMIAALTVPLVLSWKNPEPGPKGDFQRGFRRATYITLGAGEVFLAGTMIAQYLTKQNSTIVGTLESGLSDKALLLGAVQMIALIGMRAVFLVWKPEWLEEHDGTSRKTKYSE